MSDATYKLDELARAAGTSARTVRYYVQRGLLPAPAFRGKDTAYGHDHLVRLRAIRRLQEAYFPLDAIAAELARRSSDEIERLAEGQEMPRRDLEPEPTAEKPSARAETSEAIVGRLHRRIALAPGVELDIADDAPPDSMRLVEALLKDFRPKPSLRD